MTEPEFRKYLVAELTDIKEKVQSLLLFRAMVWGGAAVISVLGGFIASVLTLYFLSKGGT